MEIDLIYIWDILRLFFRKIFREIGNWIDNGNDGLVSLFIFGCLIIGCVILVYVVAFFGYIILGILLYVGFDVSLDHSVLGFFFYGAIQILSITAIGFTLYGGYKFIFWVGRGWNFAVKQATQLKMERKNGN